MPPVRMRTRAAVVVHSHVVDSTDKGKIDLSNDVIAVQTSKSIKGAGGATLTIVPRRNYLNLIFPNDVINIYFDPGDGKRGFVRTFFGYVDRIERSVTTDDSGATSTTIRLTCTDMTKAFDRTDIYFNPHIADRTDLLDSRFGDSALAGLALMSRGIRAHGTPADMIESLATLILGFGMQWTLPESYKANASVIKKNQQQRLQRTLARVPNSEQAQVVALAGDNAKLDLASAELDSYVKLINEAITTGGESSDASVVAAASAQKNKLAALLEGSMELSAYNTVLKEQGGSLPYTILDLVDFSFIEAMSISGYITSESIWQQQGTLASAMYGYSNEVVNELFFDLRPVVSDSNEGLEDSCFGKEYSREPDELGVNVNGIGSMAPPSRPGVRYAPAIVMREYPYSTAEGIDLSHLFVSDVGGEYGFVPFGPVFGLNINPPEPCRAIYDYSTVSNPNAQKGISPNNGLFTDISRPLKHLDVVPITSQDVKEESLGRSDAAIYNLFTLFATGGGDENYKYMMQDLLPIVTPVSIARNGLRLRNDSSMYANFSQDNLTKGSGIDNVAIRQNLSRWAFLLDHWDQHNGEYLDGDITLRGMPEIRVGYRLDYADRHESYYVESVSHRWQYPDAMTTTVTVSRGQRNDPMPAYVPPAVSKDFGKPLTQEDLSQRISEGGASASFNGLYDSGFVVEEKDVASVTSFASRGGGNRTSSGRLGKYFYVNPTHATSHSGQNTGSDRNLYVNNAIDKGEAFDGPGGFAGAYEPSVQERWDAFSNAFISSTDSGSTPEWEKELEELMKADAAGLIDTPTETF